MGGGVALASHREIQSENRYEDLTLNKDHLFTTLRQHSVDNTRKSLQYNPFIFVKTVVRQKWSKEIKVNADLYECEFKLQG